MLIIVLLNEQAGILMEQIIYQVTNYDEEAVYKAVSKALSDLHVQDDLKPDMRIVLKPNLVMAKKPEFPVTTHRSEERR